MTDLKICIEKLELVINSITAFLKYLTDNKEKIEKIYASKFENYKHNSYKSVDGKLLIIKDTAFEKFYNEIILFLDYQNLFLKDLKDFISSWDQNKDSKLSRYMDKLINECIDAVKEYEYLSTNNEYEIFNILNKPTISNNYRSILLLKDFAKYEKNIVLIGGNGSGKTTFANALKGCDLDLISVIPAQKNLYFIEKDYQLLNTNIKEMEMTIIENNIEKGKNDNYGNDYYSYQNTQFSKLIYGMRTGYISYLCKCQETNEKANIDNTVYGKVKRIFNTLFQDIELKIDYNDNNRLYCVKQDNKYSINKLSEGEKAVLYYSISVLIAKDNGFIIVDEPETYLNPSLTNILWDLLIKEKQNCQFIFITHSIDFVLGLNNKIISWIKKYNGFNKWDFKILPNDSNLPNSMLTEILGSKKPILFCEGDSKNSLDYHIYRAILGKDYTVIPSGGHQQVISYCRAVNNIKLEINLTIDAYGIIDGDLISDDAKIKYNEDNIFVLPFNEIEMFILEEQIIRKTLLSSYSQEREDKIKNFMEDLWKKVEDNKNKIAFAFAKSIIDETLHTYTIKTKNNIDNMKIELNDLSNINVDDIYNKKLDEIEDIIIKKDYKNLLKVCNLKEEISHGLANSKLDNDYVNKAIGHIQKDEELQSYLRCTYFSFLK